MNTMKNITPKDFGSLLFTIHTHGELVQPDEIVYREEALLKLLKGLGFPDPEWGGALTIEEFLKRKNR